MPTYARLVRLIGSARTLQLIYTAAFVDGEEAVRIGLASELTSDVEGRLAELCAQLVGHAPLTMRASKIALRRLRSQALPPDEDLVSLCYGSDDFREGVAAFLEKRPPDWQGRCLLSRGRWLPVRRVFPVAGLWSGGFPYRNVCSVVAADFTGGHSRVKGAFGVGFADGLRPPLTREPPPP
jgi:hypothetical protein